MARLAVIVVAVVILQAAVCLAFDGSQPRVYYAEMLTVPGGVAVGIAAFTDPAADLFHAVWYSVSAQYGLVDFSLVEAETGTLVLQLSDPTKNFNSDWFDETMSTTGNPIAGSSLATFNMSFYAVKAVDHTTKTTVLLGQLRPLSQCQWLGVLSFDQLIPVPSTAPGQMPAANALLSQSSLTTWDWQLAGRLDFMSPVPSITAAWLYDTGGSADVQFCTCAGCSLCGSQYNFQGIGSTSGLSVVELNLDLYNLSITSSNVRGNMQGQMRRSPNPAFDSSCPGVTVTPSRTPTPTKGAVSSTPTPCPSPSAAAVSASPSRVIGSRSATVTALPSRGYGASNSRAPSGFPSDTPTPSLKRCTCADTPPSSLTCTKPSPFCLDYDPVNLCCCAGSWSCDVVPAATTSSSSGGKKSAAALSRTSPVMILVALFFLLFSMLAL